VTLGAGETYANGIFHSANAAALATEATLDGKDSLVIAFRGSDDATDSLHDLQNINADYPLFASLIQAVDAAAASGRYDQVVVTGHSLGGAMAQLYMAEHADQPGGVTHDATTFGSPGAVLPAGEDARITNFVIADDPAVALGAHRAEVGAILRSDDTLAHVAANEAAQVFPGLTADQAMASLASLTVNYENRGEITVLPGQDPAISPATAVAGLAQLDAGQHAPELYASSVALAAAQPGHEVVVPEAPVNDAGLLALRAIYDGDGYDPQAAQGLFDAWVHGLRSDAVATGNDAFTTVRDGLEQLGHDLHLFG
ncbi:MAG: DUF2974 domain-containing protein, partial [Acetobacteraceae bacterium]